MGKLITVAVFQYPQEAHVLKSHLESEDIRVLLKDELTVQTDNFLSNAIGGVKLQIDEEDLPLALPILELSGAYPPQEDKPFEFITKADDFTKNMPLLGSLPMELRLALLFMIPIIAFFVLLFFLS